MLFVGCGGCRRVVPLFCGGQLFPHMPLEAVQVGNSVGCMMCGIQPPIFTCTFCFTQQVFLVPGAANAFPQLQMQMQAFGARQMPVAPVVAAPAGTGEGIVHGMMKDAAKSFASSVGSGLAKQLLGAFFGGGQ